jgi:exportin-T
VKYKIWVIILLMISEPDLFPSFQTTYQNSNPEVTCLTLDVIGAYISWIDINLIANNRFVSVLMQFMNMPLLRESACDCIHEIISKGMEPVMKTKLIESFASVLQDTGVMNVADVSLS